MKDSLKTISIMEKVFLDSEPKLEVLGAEIASNERFCFQVAFKTDENYLKQRLVFVESDLIESVSLKFVRSVPVGLAVYDEKERDDYFIDTKAGMYPDALMPIKDNVILASPKKWQSLWITVYNKKGLPVGVHDICVILKDADGTETGRVNFKLTVNQLKLPENDLIITNWLHYDCIKEVYNVEVFSDEYFSILEKHFVSQIEHGCTMLYVPLFTPPLDTAVGVYRDTVQTVKVIIKDGKYTFDFSLLKKLICLAKDNGYKYFEFSHLFSQWGAKYSPKILVDKDGRETLYFGWHTPSDSNEYLEFLDAFLIKLNLFVEEMGIENCCYLHLSDEPKTADIERYRQICAFVKDRTKIKVIDAMSHKDYVDEKLIDFPAISLASHKNFDEFNDKLIYTCCVEFFDNLTNRFIAMQPLRTRILGVQMYLYQVKGYLHWGYNFYHSELSYKKINPFEITDGCGGFPSGDAFIVYPNASDKEVIESIRHELFSRAIQDYNALKLYESVYGVEKTIELIKSYNINSFEDYPHNERVIDELVQYIYSNIN